MENLKKSNNPHNQLLELVLADKNLQFELNEVRKYKNLDIPDYKSIHQLKEMKVS